MKRCISGTIIFLLAGVAAAAQAQAPARTAQTKAPEIQAPVAIRPISPNVTRRFETLHPKLQPTARSWIEQQARIEAQRSNPDLAGLNGAVRQRFGGPNTSLSDMDISSLVFLVLAQVAQNAQSDLQNIMAQMQAINAQKQALRQLENEMNQAAAQMKSQLEKEYAAVRCATALCDSIPARLASARAATSKMRRPVNLSVPEHLTYGDFSRIRAQLPSTIDSLGGLSQEQQLEMQMIMDRMTKADEAASIIEKKMSDVASSIIANIK
jgi:hypothetical protein